MKASVGAKADKGGDDGEATIVVGDTSASGPPVRMVVLQCYAFSDPHDHALGKREEEEEEEQDEEEVQEEEEGEEGEGGSICW